MPDVPNVPGVPSLTSYGFDPVTLLTSDLLLPGLINAIAGPQWGIYLSASSFSGPIGSLLSSIGIPGVISQAIANVGVPLFPAIFPDSFVSFELKQDFSISDYPVEGGGFQSYNKVQLPTEIRVQVSKGGSQFERQAFLASIDAQMATTLLYDVITPESVYLNYNFDHRDFRRTAKNGSELIVVDLWLKQIRITSSTTFASVISPAVAGVQALGNVQATQAPAPLAITVFKGAYP